MLSYRHAFHAGNHADVLKHTVLSRIVLHLVQKEKPFSYIDTHAGAGLYKLDSEWAQTTGEAEAGILPLLALPDIPELLLPYLTLCRNLHENGHRYPGSPEIVRALSRSTDQLTLMELHPTEIQNLRANFPDDPRIHIHHRDGFSGLSALCPPEPRRGFALIDPSYETADDYTKTAEALLTAHRRWPVGILTLWYPLLARRAEAIASLKERFALSGIPGILCTELIVGRKDPQAEGDFGLFGSGMIIMQPHWKLKEEMESVLPWLAGKLGFPGQGSFNLDWLTVPKEM